MLRANRILWEEEPKSVRVTYVKFKAASSIQSTAGHVKPGGKRGGPPSKPKYYPMTDSEEYCEGKVKSTPGGE